MTEWARGNQTEERGANDDLGGTMRLGAYPCRLIEGTRVRDTTIGADQRTAPAPLRSEHQPAWTVGVGGAALLRPVAGRALPEIVELPGHPWFVGVQFHPELKSKPLNPHPLFIDFIRAAIEQSRLV